MSLKPILLITWSAWFELSPSSGVVGMLVVMLMAAVAIDATQKLRLLRLAKRKASIDQSVRREMQATATATLLERLASFRHRVEATWFARPPATDTAAGPTLISSQAIVSQHLCFVCCKIAHILQEQDLNWPFSEDITSSNLVTQKKFHKGVVKPLYTKYLILCILYQTTSATASRFIFIDFKASGPSLWATSLITEMCCNVQYHKRDRDLSWKGNKALDGLFLIWISIL